MNLVFLPATESSQTQYGVVPQHLDQFPEAVVHTVNFPHLVWYNSSVQAEAIAQIRALGLSSFVLIGFSKSGLGAWNITRQMPDLVSATIIFDSPMTRESLPSWGTSPFYQDDLAWQKDLPANSIDHFCDVTKKDHQLILISSSSFHNEMLELSTQLEDRNYSHHFLNRHDLEHHWNSGWIEDGLNLLRD